MAAPARQLLLALLARRASITPSPAAALQFAAEPLLLQCSRGVASSVAPPLAIWPGSITITSHQLSNAINSQQHRGFAAEGAATSTVQGGPQVGDVLDVEVQEVQEQGLKLRGAGVGAAEDLFLPRRAISKVKLEVPLTSLFQAGEVIKVLVTGRHHQGRLYLATRNFEEEPGSIVKDKQAVFARAPQVAEAYREEGAKKGQERRRFMDSVNIGDGPFEATVVALRGQSRIAVLKVNEHLFSCFVKPTRIPREQAVIGQKLQVWCVAKTDTENVPVFSSRSPAELAKLPPPPPRRPRSDAPRKDRSA